MNQMETSQPQSPGANSPPSSCCDYTAPTNFNDRDHDHDSSGSGSGSCGGNEGIRYLRQSIRKRRRRSDGTGTSIHGFGTPPAQAGGCARRSSCTNTCSGTSSQKVRRSSLASLSSSLGGVLEDFIFTSGGGGDERRRGGGMSAADAGRLLLNHDKDASRASSTDGSGVDKESCRTAPPPLTSLRRDGTIDTAPGTFTAASTLDASSRKRSAGIIRNLDVLDETRDERRPRRPSSARSYLSGDALDELIWEEITVPPLSVDMHRAHRTDADRHDGERARSTMMPLLVAAVACAVLVGLTISSIGHRQEGQGQDPVAEAPHPPIIIGPALLNGQPPRPVPHVSDSLELALQQIKMNMEEEEEDEVPPEEGNGASSSSSNDNKEKHDDIFSPTPEQDETTTTATSPFGKAKKNTKNKNKVNRPKKQLQVLVECRSNPDGCLKAIKASSSSLHIDPLHNSKMVSLNVDPQDFDRLRSIDDIDFEMTAIDDEVDEVVAGGGGGDHIPIPPRLLRGPRRETELLHAGTPPHFRLIQAIDEGGKRFAPGPYRPRICLADTGTCRDHPDIRPHFPGQLNGVDLTLNGETLSWHQDVDGHGCHNNGIVNSAGNDVGYFGIGGSDVFVTRALRDDRKGTVSQVMTALDQCVEAGATIIVIPLGCTNCRQELTESYFQDLAAQGVMIVASAGNTGSDPNVGMTYPASFPRSVVSVGAVNLDESHWEKSAVNEQVEFCAPGVHILSTGFSLSGDDYEYEYTHRTGTSMSVPQFAAAVGLLKSHFSRCTAQQIRSVLAHTAKKIDDGTGSKPQCTSKCGFGIIQIQEAHDLLRATGDGDNYRCDVAGLILSSTERVCDCIDSNYSPSSCLPVARSPMPSQMPKCTDDTSARVRIKRTVKRRRRRRSYVKISCAKLRKSRGKKRSWCQASSEARSSCRNTCASVGIEYNDCDL